MISPVNFYVRKETQKLIQRLVQRLVQTIKVILEIKRKSRSQDNLRIYLGERHILVHYYYFMITVSFLILI